MTSSTHQVSLRKTGQNKSRRLSPEIVSTFIKILQKDMNPHVYHIPLAHVEPDKGNRIEHFRAEVTSDFVEQVKVREKVVGTQPSNSYFIIFTAFDGKVLVMRINFHHHAHNTIACQMIYNSFGFTLVNINGLKVAVTNALGNLLSFAKERGQLFFSCEDYRNILLDKTGNCFVPHTRNLVSSTGPSEHYRTVYMLLFLRDWVGDLQSELDEERVDDMIRYIVFSVLYETANYY